MTAKYQIRQNTVQIQATVLYLETYSFLPNSANIKIECEITFSVHFQMQHSSLELYSL